MAHYVHIQDDGGNRLNKTYFLALGHPNLSYSDETLPHDFDSIREAVRYARKHRMIPWRWIQSASNQIRYF